MFEGMPGKKPFISIIILNWNGKKFLYDCLDSLEKQTYRNFEIILVDNGSTDKSIDFVKKRFPRVKIIENKKNLGFAKGNNVGIKRANGKYIFILNNDTKTDANCLENLIKATKKNNDDKIGMFAPKILSIKNPAIIDSVGINIYPDGMSRGRGRMEINKKQYEKIEEILMPSGCAALYKKEMLDEIGFFDEIFFAYCEDTDLGLRGRLAGWKSVLVPSAIVYHWYSGTTGEFSSFKAFLVERNHFFVAFKNFPLSLILLLPFYTILRYILVIYGVLINKSPIVKSKFSKIKLAFILLKSYISFFKLLPIIIKKRRIIQKNKRITNKEIYELIQKYRIKLSEITLS